MVPPRVKEPRFLQQGRFAQTTASRYSVNFEQTAARRDAVTFDASPIYLRSAVAPQYVSKWLPDAKLIAMVRDPQQRAYSHWRMAHEWIASKCTTAEQLSTLRPIRPLITFRAVIERSLMLHHWNGCARSLKEGGSLKEGAAPPSASGFSWLKLPAAERTRLSAVGVGDEEAAAGRGTPFYDCLRGRDAELMARYRAELLGEWPSSAEEGELSEAIRLLNHCGEMMINPPGLLVKGFSYAAELRRCARRPSLRPNTPRRLPCERHAPRECSTGSRALPTGLSPRARSAAVGRSTSLWSRSA